ncbi:MULTISPECIES: hypothetical protein [unclassified Mucilaginibacter]|uniref:hypothetical protein n=1 Tax=unclassified Mucilaginibacter TaxID=2617802 RepID=UPI003397741D
MEVNSSMKIFKFALFTIIIPILLLSCFGEAHQEKLKGGYYLNAMDVNKDMHIGYQDGKYGVGVIKATVHAVGQNDSFIIVKQHPKDFPDKNKSVINYYIIPLKNRLNRSVEKSFYGPLTSYEFEQKREELKIKDIGFTRVFKDLE